MDGRSLARDREPPRRPHSVVCSPEWARESVGGGQPARIRAIFARRRSAAMRNLKVIGKAFVDVYDNMFVLLLANLIYVILAAVPVTGFVSIVDSALREPENLSGAPVVAALMALLWVLLAGPAGYALAVMLRRVTEFESFTVRDYLGAMRQNLRRAWVMGLVSIGGTTLLVINLGFYATVGGWGALLLPLFLVITLFWLLMQMYVYPLAVITEGGPLPVLRNAAIIVVRRPGLTLLTALVCLILIAISTVLVIPWVIITVGALTALGTRAVRSAVRRDFGLPEDDPLVDEPLPPIVGEGEDPQRPLLHYGWRAGRREAEKTDNPGTEA
jgi:uncharacterized membrane protein YesL